MRVVSVLFKVPALLVASARLECAKQCTNDAKHLMGDPRREVWVGPSV